MDALQIVGVIGIAALFVGLFVVIGKIAGWKIAIFTFTFAISITAYIYLMVFLVMSGDT